MKNGLIIIDIILGNTRQLYMGRKSLGFLSGTY